jgi:hypothetical protein
VAVVVSKRIHCPVPVHYAALAVLIPELVADG